MPQVLHFKHTYKCGSVALLYNCSMSDVKPTIIQMWFWGYANTQPPTCKRSLGSFWVLLHFCFFWFAQHELFVQAIGPRQLSLVKPFMPWSLVCQCQDRFKAVGKVKELRLNILAPLSSSIKWQSYRHAQSHFESHKYCTFNALLISLFKICNSFADLFFLVCHGYFRVKWDIQYIWSHGLSIGSFVPTAGVPLSFMWSVVFLNTGFFLWPQPRLSECFTAGQSLGSEGEFLY